MSLNFQRIYINISIFKEPDYEIKLSDWINSLTVDVFLYQTIYVLFFQVVTALGKTYHQRCFKCNRCRQPFPSGEKVTYTGKEVLCPKCVQIPIRDATPKSSPTTNSANGEFNAVLNNYVVSVTNYFNYHMWYKKILINLDYQDSLNNFQSVVYEA